MTTPRKIVDRPRLRPRNQVRVFDPSTWDEFLTAIDEARHYLDFRDHEECFFRGHADHTWELFPTLFRQATRLGLSPQQTIDLEGDLFWEFQARAQELHQQQLTDWDYLFFMRHYGVITRVLDWTEGLGVALYFALEHHRAGVIDNSAAPCVWLLNPYSLNAHREAWDERDLVSPRFLGYLKEDDVTYDYGELVDRNLFHWTMPVAIYPIQRSNRVRAQRGWFTIHGTDQRPLEVQAQRNLAKILLPKQALDAAMRFLDDAGLNEYTIYADLDALARELHRKNGLTGAPVSHLAQPRTNRRKRT